MRIAIYARVSTDDKGQEPENQLRQLREWCAGHEIAREYINRVLAHIGLPQARAYQWKPPSR